MRIGNGPDFVEGVCVAGNEGHMQAGRSIIRVWSWWWQAWT